ncbi:MAG: flagellar hook-associated protein FlgK [Novosphingobium sp.]
MASDLISIGRSGVRAAQAGLDVTAQNIANVSTEGYVRRTARQSEVALAGGPLRLNDLSLGGVRVDGFNRNVDQFRQAEARRTGSDAARADAEVAGLEAVESAVALAGVGDAATGFEATLQALSQDTTNGSLRASVVESARGLAGTLQVAARGLDATGAALRTAATDGAGQVNQLAGQLAQTNVRLSRAATCGSDHAALLDQRDALLGRLSGYADIASTAAADGSVEVRIGGAAGPALVSGSQSAAFAAAVAGDGTLGFTLAGQPVTLGGGSLAGQAQALVRLGGTRAGIEAIATSVIAVANNAQAAGVALDGSPGQPLFGGSGASDIAVTLSSGSGLATAPAGAPAGSRDPANLVALRQALATADPTGAADAVVSDIAGAVAARTTSRDALLAIAASASDAVQAQAGVDLDSEAVNLVRYQQAFQASGRVIQVAADLFDTLLAIQ